MVVIVSGSSPAPTLTQASVSSVASFSLQRGLLSSSPAVSLSISRRRTCTVRAGGNYFLFCLLICVFRVSLSASLTTQICWISEREVQIQERERERERVK
jgi:hypothetical protein